jgi:hypothetical protein
MMFAVVGSVITFVPYVLPLILLAFVMLRAAGGRGRRRYPPYGPGR